MTVERRWAPTSVRAASNGRGIEGETIVFNQVTTIAGEFDEVIRPEAVRGVLGDGIVALYNHKPEIVLGRTPKTLSLRATSTGVNFRIEELPKSRADVLEAIRREDVTGCSFMFSVPADGSGERWVAPSQRTDGGTLPLREITRFSKILDVGPVTHPAYTSTSVSARSRTHARTHARTNGAPKRKAPRFRDAEAEIEYWKAKTRALKLDLAISNRLARLAAAERDKPEPWKPWKPERPKWTLSARRRVGFHEAGHACLAWSEGLPLAEVRLDKNRPGAGWTGWSGEAEASILVTLAGPVAERLAGYDPAETRHEREALDFAARAVGSERLRILPRFERLREDTERELRKLWPACEALADRLVDDWRLSGREAERIIREALDGSTLANYERHREWRRSTGRS